MPHVWRGGRLLAGCVLGAALLVALLGGLLPGPDEVGAAQHREARPSGVRMSPRPPASASTQPTPSIAGPHAAGRDDDGLEPEGGASPPAAVLGDPALAWASDGTLYAAFISFSRSDDAVGGLWVARSTDGGQTWPEVAPVDRNGADYFSDKDYVAVDRTSGGTRGNVYVSWTRFASDGSSAQIFLSRSTDGGRTFATTGPLSACRDTQGSVPAVGLDGAVYVAWEEFGSGSGCGDRIRVASSTDGGASFGAPVTVSPVDEIANPLPRTRFRTNSFPSLAVGPSGDLYIAWADDRSGNADILFSRSTDGGATWSSDPLTGQPKPTRVNDDATTRAQFFPWLAVTPEGDVGVLFMDRRRDLDDVKMDAFLAVSHDQGQTFGPNVRVSSASSNPRWDFDGTFVGDYIGLAAFSNGFQAAWTDTRNEEQEIVSARIRLDANGVPSPSPENEDASSNKRPQNEPSVAVDPSNASRAAIGANDYRVGDSSLWVYRTADGGASWRAARILDPVDGRNFLVFPSPKDVQAAAQKSKEIRVTWTDVTNGERGFRIFRRKRSSSKWTRIGTVDANVEQFIDRGIRVGSTYCYRVLAVARDGSVAASTGEPCVRVLSRPVLTSPPDDARVDQPPRLDWRGVAGADSYVVEISDRSDLSGATSLTTTSSSLTPGALGRGTWYWRVTAQDASGSSSAPSRKRSFTIR